mmetsp:Transcript_19481/g.61248  ORF Transcript_19481/g.61248 Transcript_19481/m.61248 type:complete len:249 (-) Transcript_19481:804-1550(-)
MGIAIETKVSFYSSMDAAEMKAQVVAAQKALSALKELKRGRTPQKAVETTIYSLSLKKASPGKATLFNEAEIIKGVESGMRFWDDDDDSETSLAYGFGGKEPKDDDAASLSSFSDYDSEFEDDFEEDEFFDAYEDAVCDEDKPSTLLQAYEDVLDDYDDEPLLLPPPVSAPPVSASPVSPAADDDPYASAEDTIDAPADLKAYDDACDDGTDAPALLGPLVSRSVRLVEIEEYEENIDSPALLPACFI